MECTVYQYNERNQCKICEDEKIDFSEREISEMLGTFGCKISESFTPWFCDSLNDITLKFKYDPPSRQDVEDHKEPRSLTLNPSEEGTLLDFCPVYCKDFVLNQNRKSSSSLEKDLQTKIKSLNSSPDIERCLVKRTIQEASGNDSSTSCKIVKENQSSLSLEQQERSAKSSQNYDRTNPITNCAEKSATAGEWCINVSSCKNLKQKQSSIRKADEELLERIKKGSNINNFHRGKWVITRKCCETKMTSLWKELCRMLKCGELPNCNAKFQKSKREVWIYCDVLYSCEVRRKLKKKLNITAPLPYYVHPHGVVVQL